MVKEKLCYLAGAITKFYEMHEFSDALSWRQQAEEVLKDCDINTFNPTLNYQQNLNYSCKSVPYQNLSYLQKSTFVLVNLKYLEFSPGTIWELSLAWFLHIPVIAFEYSKLQEQPHIAEAITIHFDTMEEAIDYIKSEYIQ